MAHASLGLMQGDRFGLKARYQRLRDAAARYSARRAIYRRTLRELQAITDRDLADLGFHRSEIPRVAKEAAERI